MKLFFGLFRGRQCASWGAPGVLARLLVALAGAAAPGVPAAQDSGAALVGRWQYLQPPDQEGEVLDISFSGGRYRAIMNGLERAGEHGLFYYVIEPADFTVAVDGSIGFTVGERSFFGARPPLSRIGGQGNRGVSRDQMRFHGRIERGDLVLQCEGAGGSCPDAMLRFKKIAAQRSGHR